MTNLWEGLREVSLSQEGQMKLSKFGVKILRNFRKLKVNFRKSEVNLGQVTERLSLI